MDNARMKLFKEDSIILAENSITEYMYKIIRGKAAIYLHYGETEEYLVGILSEGKCFGEVGLLSGKPELYTVVAFTDVLTLLISWDNFNDFLTENHRDVMDIMKNMASTLYVMKANIDLLADEIKNPMKNDAPREIPRMERMIRSYVMHSPGEALSYGKRI